MAYAELESDGKLKPAQSRLQILKLTADQSFTGGTSADIVGMSFPVVSGRYYHFKFVVLFESDTQLSGLILEGTFPAVTVCAARIGVMHGSDGVDAEWQASITFTGDKTTTNQVPVANVEFMATVEGLIVPSADGTYQLRAAIDGTGTMLIRQGTCLFLTDYT